jgi:hypothetical protein
MTAAHVVNGMDEITVEGIGRGRARDHHLGQCGRRCLAPAARASDQGHQRALAAQHDPSLRNMLAGLAPGAPFKMSVLRAGKVIELTGTSH